MERLSYELIHKILLYINDPLDLIRLSNICHHWRSAILNDEYLLNQWFSRSLEYSQESCRGRIPSYQINCERKSIPYIDESLFPVNLRSNEWYVLPWSLPSYLNYDNDSSMYYYQISLSRSPHCFSFWLFLPRQCEFQISITSWNVQGVVIWLNGDKQYSYGKGKRLSIGDRWTHVVISKHDLQSNYQLCLDGQYLSELSRHEMFSIKATRNFITPQNILSFRRCSEYEFGTFSAVRIADFVCLKRCLTLVEIRAILQQQTSIKLVKIGTYIKNNKLHHMIVSHNNSNSYSFSLKFIFVVAFILLIFCFIFSVTRNFFH